MDNLTLIIDQPETGILRLTLEAGDQVLATQDLPYEGHVDNVLLTAVDNLLQGNRIDKSALRAVRAGGGIDKNSSLYRMVTSFASAIAAAHTRQT